MTNDKHRPATSGAKQRGGGPSKGQPPAARQDAGKPAHSKPKASARRHAPGLMARALAVEVLILVLDKHLALDEALAQSFANPRFAGLEARDRAMARLIATTALRRYGELTEVVGSFLSKPLAASKSGRVPMILVVGAAQLLALDTPPHAAISLAVDLAGQDPRGAHLKGLTNAVLRKIAAEGKARLAALDAIAINVPVWMLERWTRAYGADMARRITAASLDEAPLDISVKSDPSGWAEKLGGTLLPTGTIRMQAHGPVRELPGFAEGAWWVQDAAAALPARLLGNVAGRRIADLCAAPGGKTAELLARGARVTAVDMKPERLKRLQENLTRLGLEAECIAADAASWSPGRTFDGVLLDAPCTASGTIRRHPDILHLKRSTDLQQILPVQAALIENAARLVAPGGRIVYATCSLEPEEGEQQIARFLAAHADFERLPVAAEELGVETRSITADGDLRTLPFHMAGTGDTPGGCDGFYAARLVRKA